LAKAAELARSSNTLIFGCGDARLGPREDAAKTRAASYQAYCFSTMTRL
jgi:hypothetical protein